jgi:hypothetical protein
MTRIHACSRLSRRPRGPVRGGGLPVVVPFSSIGVSAVSGSVLCLGDERLVTFAPGDGRGEGTEQLLGGGCELVADGAIQAGGFLVPEYETVVLHTTQCVEEDPRLDMPATVGTGVDDGGGADGVQEVGVAERLGREGEQDVGYPLAVEEVVRAEHSRQEVVTAHRHPARRLGRCRRW